MAIRQSEKISQVDSNSSFYDSSKKVKISRTKKMKK